MCKVDCCCCCVKDVILGAKIIGIVYLIWSIFGFINGGASGDIGSIVGGALLLLANILLLVGLYQKMPVLVLVWLIVMSEYLLVGSFIVKASTFFSSCSHPGAARHRPGRLVPPAHDLGRRIRHPLRHPPHPADSLHR